MVITLIHKVTTMKRLFILALLSSVYPTLIFSQPSQSMLNEQDKVRLELINLRRTFFDAQKQGNRQLLENLLADSFYFVHSTGVLTNKKEFIDRTVAQAGKGPEIEFLSDQLFLYNNSAVWLTRSVSRAPNGTESNFRATDVLVKGDKGWQWVSVHSTKLATRPKAFAISPDSLKTYVGKYQITADRNLVVTLEGNSLTGLAPGLRQRDLIPVSANEFVWFSDESNADMRISFKINDRDHIAYAILQSEGIEVWRAKKVY